MVDRKPFQVLLREKYPKVAYISGCYFELSVKKLGTRNEVYKTLFVLQGNIDTEYTMLLHYSSSIKQQVIRFLIALAAVYRVKFWLQNVLQAYL